jgi:hypothetical protein
VSIHEMRGNGVERLDTRLSETWSACVAFDAISKSISVASWLRVKGFVIMLATHCEKVKVFN